MIRSRLGRVVLGIVLMGLSGCTTIKPRISASNFHACSNLCRGSRGAASIASVIEISYTGSVKVISEECACKNKRTFSIIESEQ